MFCVTAERAFSASAAAVASTQADRPRELLGQPLHFLARARRSAGIVEPLSRCQLLTQTFQPLPVGCSRQPAPALL